MLKVWGRRSSFNVQKLMWLIGGFELAHDAAALARCARDFGKLDRLLEGRSFLLGETLSLADITAGTSLYRYFELEIERLQLAGVEYRALREREAFRTPVMIPFGELRGRLLDF